MLVGGNTIEIKISKEIRAYPEIIFFLTVKDKFLCAVRAVLIAVTVYFAKGSLNTFAKQINVDVNNRILCYNIKNLGKQLKTIGMLVVLDSIFNRITKNRKLKLNTYIFIDEIYLLFQNEYSANFLFMLWKRVRKYDALCTGITQNIPDLLVSQTACTMLSNSEFLIMLNQAPTDRMSLQGYLISLIPSYPISR